MKTVKISDETWQKLMQLKIHCKKKSVDDALNMLLQLNSVKDELKSILKESVKVLRGEIS